MTTGPRLAAVWFADLVGFTRLSATDETLAIKVVRIVHDCAKEAIEEGGGRVVKLLGDGVMAEFTSAEAAVRAALSLNLRSDRETSRLRGGPFPLRTGVHVGEIAVAEDGDIYGSGVNIASRICGQAEPGTVVVSDDLHRVLRARREFTFSPMGDRAMKGLDEEIPVYQVEASPRLTTMILSDEGLQDAVAEAKQQLEDARKSPSETEDETPVEEAPGGARGTMIMGSVPTIPREETGAPEGAPGMGGPTPGSLISDIGQPRRDTPQPPPQPLHTPAMAAASGPADDEIRFDDDSGPSGAGGGDRETLMLEPEEEGPGASPTEDREAPATDLSGRSAYTRVLMGGKSETPPRPSTPSASAERAMDKSGSASRTVAAKSVPAWVLGTAGVALIAVLVFIILAIFG